ncbi:MAG: hypothetical protein U9P14_06595, partial [Gemmatimonadota bacterium]|nr:hypothetical protein [Gemmatimonadota bacterium]
MDIVERGIFEGQPYRVVRSKRQVHGWWPGRRECTGERLLVNPYSGCGHDCPLCYANAFPFSHFRHFRETGEVTVAHQYHREVAKQLDSIDWAACGYLSPVTDPFQPLEKKFRLSVRIVEAFVKRNLPVEFITRGRIPADVLSLMAGQEHSFGQVSIVTPREGLRRRLSPGSADTEVLLENLERITAVRRPLHFPPMPAVLRIDPVFPFISDDPGDLKNLVREASARGVKHLIASSLDVPAVLSRKAFQWMYSLQPSPPVPFEELFCERIGPRFHAGISYRLKLFSLLRDLTVEAGMSFALCMEFEKSAEPGGPAHIRGLNAKFMTGTTNCEGVDIPVYRRNREDTYRSEATGAELPRFGPATDKCSGNCLMCSDPLCGLPDMSQ